jgi:hypothetical protein
VAFTVSDGDLTDSETITIEVANTGNATISGNIFNTSRAAMAGVNVRYYNEAINYASNSTSDTNGAYSFSGMPTGIVEMMARPDVSSEKAWKKRYIYLADSDNETGVDFTLDQGYLVTGLIVDSTGSPVEGVSVNAECENGVYFAETTSSASGRYEMRLPAGNYGISIDEESAYKGNPQFVTVSGDVAVSNVVVYNSDTGSSITGSVTSGEGIQVREGAAFAVLAFSGGSLSGVNIANFDKYAPVSMALVTPPGGSYNLVVPPSANYDVCLGVSAHTESGVESFTVRGSLLNTPADSAGASFSYDSTGGTISGTVRYGDTNLLKAEVILTNSLGYFVGFAETDQNGAYNLYNVPAGTYTLQAKYNGETSGVVSCTVTDGESAEASMTFSLTPPMVTGNIDGDANGRDDIIIDFGSSHGIWIYYNNADWWQLHTVSPESMAVGDLDANGRDDIIIDFGSSHGIWIYYNNADWWQLDPTNPESITTGDLDANGKDDIIIDFGSSYGIWIYYNNADWWQLHALSPESITTGNADGTAGDDLIIDFGPSYGIWIYYNNAEWGRLHELSADSVVAGAIDAVNGNDIIIDFGPSYGIWIRYNNSDWWQLHPVSPE